MIAIVFVLHPNFAPYIKKYIQLIKESGMEYRIIYWNRMNTNVQFDVNEVVYHEEKDLSSNKLNKVRSYLKFRQFLNREFEKGYNKVILLTTLAGLLLDRKNLIKYRDKIIFDIRDFTYESIPLYKRLVKRVVDNSAFTVISSPGFVNFLPKSDKFVINHNITVIENNESLGFKAKFPISIGFVGAIRHFAVDRKIIDIFGNDDRFRIEFHGFGKSYETLNEYVKHRKILNVRISGYYDNSKKKELYKNIDVINNYYGYNRVNKYAVSNKFYDSLILKKPILVNNRVYLGEVVEKYNLGFSIDLKHFDKEKFINDYFNFNFNNFITQANTILDKCLKEEDYFNLKVLEFLNI